MIDERRLRAERVEHAGTRDMVAALEPELAARLGMSVEPVSGRAGALVCATSTDTLFNRVMGLGVETPARPDDIDALRDTYRRRGVARYLVHLVPETQPPELGAWLAAAGFAPFRRAWMKFAMATADAPATIAPPDRLEVREIGRPHAEAFGALIGRIFHLAGTEQIFAALAGRAGWHLWMAFDGETPVATAGMFVGGGDAWLGFGGCDPAYRRRGAQSALLATRVRRAADLGCRDVFTETGEAVPGEPQTSYRNIERAGLAPLYRRENLLAPA